MSFDLGLGGKTVLITGGSKGIGLACAQGFAAAGCDLVLVSRDAVALATAADAVRGAAQVKVATHAADLGDAGARENLAAAHPDIDILVNNAGAIPGGRVQDLSFARWSEAWALKVMGYIHLTMLYLPLMEARRAGVILNIIGMAGRSPRADYVCGATGNASLIAFTEAVGGRSVDAGVRVLGLNPAATKTDRIQRLARTKAAAKFGDENRWEDTLADLPLGRAIDPSEVADLAVFLASVRAAYISGTVVDLDGGGRNRG